MSNRLAGTAGLFTFDRPTSSQSEHREFKAGRPASVLSREPRSALGVVYSATRFAASAACRLRPGDRAIATAELVSDCRNRVFNARAELRDERGALLANVPGKYLPVSSADVKAMLADSVGDATPYTEA